METQSWILGIIFVALCALMVLWPFVSTSRDEEEQPASSRMEDLLARREAIYTTIRELDFDFETGKLTEEDYRAQREAWVEQGVLVLKELDALRESGAYVPVSEPGVSVPRVGVSGGADLDAQIEAAIAARRRTA